MSLHSETAAPVGRDGGEVVREAFEAHDYITIPPIVNVTDIAAAIMERLRLSPRIARLICHLAQIGGRAG